MALAKAKPAKKVAKKVVQHYVHFEKVARRTAEGWKVIPVPKDYMGKKIGKNGGDLVLMEKSI